MCRVLSSLSLRPAAQTGWVLRGCRELQDRQAAEVEAAVDRQDQPEPPAPKAWRPQSPVRPAIPEPQLRARQERLRQSLGLPEPPAFKEQPPQ